MAMRHRQAQRQLTVPDSFALALAKMNGWTLLTGDGPLRELARAESVDCHGVLWLLDEFETQGVATHLQLHTQRQAPEGAQLFGIRATARRNPDSGEARR